jgi:LytS/YehU family sensor histidine kinase
MGFIFAGPPAVCAMFLTLKMFKKYYSKMVERNILIKENANAELQFLKAQIHPHFLFNTLNNIYSFALNRSNETSDLVLKLKNTIGYMVNDCNVESVLLKKEIRMLDNYIGLERVRYGERLNFIMEITGNYQNKMIAPLLLIPFVENSFKHGISKMRGNCQINLSVSVIDDQLEFRISNDKLQELEMQPSKKGIGLLNVKKRLQLLYPDKHVLEIHSTEKTYEVYLKVELEEAITKIKESPVKTLAYA